MSGHEDHEERITNMLLTDSHCHLAMVENAGELLSRARADGVSGIVVPGTNLGDAEGAIAVARSTEGVWAAVGFHPHDAKDCDDAAFSRIEELARSEKVVAIGEIGLDYHYNHSPAGKQKEVFVRHLELARKLDLPVIIHNRESTADLLDLLRSFPAGHVRGVLHSFTETTEVARELVDLGFMISFSGILTFRTAESLRAAASSLPHDRVLIETDTPYLAPVPHRGKSNEPAFVRRIAETLALLWSVPVSQVAESTTTNFENFFRVKIPR